MKKWNVEYRDRCKVCGKPPKGRFRTYCSTKCRNERNNEKQAKKGYGTDWNRKKRDREASIPDPENKCQCLICGKWYVQVCSHVYQVHGMTGREYREYFELEVKKGVVPEWYRKVKGDIAFDNETYLNLRKGAKFRFKKGQEGVGKYKRSETTLERLRNLHKLNKKNVCTK